MSTLGSKWIDIIIVCKSFLYICWSFIYSYKISYYGINFKAKGCSQYHPMLEFELYKIITYFFGWGPLFKSSPYLIYIYGYIQCWTLAWWLEYSLMAWKTWVQSQVKSYQRLKKWYDASLLNIQHYKVWIKGKVEQSRERSSIFPYTLV